MAISTNTFRVNAGWAKSDVILQMEQAFAWMGWHHGYETGHVVGLSTFWGGGDTNFTDTYQDVRQKSSSGVGTNASFYVYRDSLGVRYVLVNRPGVGYTSGELITIDGNDIGGVSNGAADLFFKVCVNESVAVGATLGIAYTNINNAAYNFIGTDRNGVVGGGQTIITIREGDVLNITNNYSNSYSLGIKTPFPEENTGLSQNNGQIAGLDYYLTINETTSFRPKIGQSGEYFFSSYSNNYVHNMGRLIVQPWQGNPGDRSLVGIGSTATFWQKNLSYTNPWGVARQEIQAGKRYGSTYRLFVEKDAGYLDLVTGSGWMYYEGGEYYGNAGNNSVDTSDYHGGTATKVRFAGSTYLDWGSYNSGDIKYVVGPMESTNYTTSFNRTCRLFHGNNTGFALDLNIFRSNLDPKFAVFSYRSPNLSSTHIGNNTFDAWIFHNFTTDIWDLDHVFLGGATQILFSGSTTDPTITFRTYFGPHDPDNQYAAAKRSAEFGYSEYNDYSDPTPNYVEYTVESLAYPHNISQSNSRVYYRSNDSAVRYSGGSSDTTGNDRVSASANFNAVIKGLPINGNLLPVPFYMPDDFVLINFHYNAANANIQQWDTITVSPSEVYTVICGSYNQTSLTRGILFCARTV